MLIMSSKVWFRSSLTLMRRIYIRGLFISLKAPPDYVKLIICKKSYLLFDLILLREEIFLNLIDPDVQPLDVHLGILSSVVAHLQLVEQLQDLVLRCLLSLDRLLLAHLQLLQVGTHHPQLLLDVLDLLLRPLGSLVASGCVRFKCGELARDVLKLVLGVGQGDLRLGQLLVKVVDGLLVG